MMRCVVLESPERLRQVGRPSPAPEPGEALVKVERIGVCGTDLHAFRGRQPFFQYPRVLGHEVAVEVVEVNARGLDARAGGVRPGDRCVLLPYLACGKCIACRRGKNNCCVDLKVLGVHVDGAMCDYMSIPLQNLVVSQTLTLEQMALVENQSIGAHAVRRAQVQPGEIALVIGLGPIGLGVVQFLKALGHQVIAMDTNPSRLELCCSHFDVVSGIDAREDPLPTLMGVTSGELPTVVFDATGHPESMMSAFRYVAHGGRLVFVGLSQAQITFDNPEFHRKELTLLSSRNATLEDFQFVMKSMENGTIKAEAMVTHRYAFDEIVEAFPRLLDPRSQVVKAIVEV